MRSRHTGQGGHRDVLGAVEDQVLVDLVGDDPARRARAPGARPARARPGVNTLPVGLCGVLSRTSRVRAENAARSDVLVDREVGEAQHRRCGGPRRRGRSWRRRSRSRARRSRPRRPARTARGPPRRSPRWRRPSRAPRGRGRRRARRSAAGARRSPPAARGRPAPAGTGCARRRWRAVAASSISRRPVGVGEALAEVDRAGAWRRARTSRRRSWCRSPACAPPADFPCRAG